MSKGGSRPHAVHIAEDFMTGRKPRVVHLVEAFEKIGGPPVLVRQIVSSGLKERYAFAVLSYSIRGISILSLMELVLLLRRLAPSLVHVHGLKPDGFHAVLAARLAGVPNVLTVVHGTTADSIGDYKTISARARRWLTASILETTTLWLSTLVYTVCKHIRVDWRLRTLPREKLRETIYNCIDVPNINRSKHAIRSENGLSFNDIVVLFVGRVCTNKGLRVLADAMDILTRESDCADVKLVLVGTGAGIDYQQILNRFSKLRDAGRAIFLGARNDIFALNAMSDIFVLPSVFKENFSFALLEASASSLPVVATNHGGNPELITHGENGLLISAGDAQSLAEMIRRLAVNPSLRAYLGEQAKLRILNVFPVENMLAKTEQLYAEITGATNTRFGETLVNPVV